MANQTIKLGGGLRQVLFFFLVCLCCLFFPSQAYFIHYHLVWFIMNHLVDFDNGKESDMKTAYMVTGPSQIYYF